MNYIPYVVEQTTAGERSFDIYSRLLKDRIIMLAGEINDAVSASIVSQLLFLDNVSNDDIYLYINSPGGSITSGMAIYDTMNYIKSDVVTICIGMAMSMGAFLLAGGKKGKRYSLKHSEIMIHQPLGGMKGQVSDLCIQAKRLIKIKSLMNEILAANTNHDIKKVANDTERDHYMSPKEAISYGIIDEIIESPKNEKVDAT